MKHRAVCPQCSHEFDASKSDGGKEAAEFEGVAADSHESGRHHARRRRSRTGGLLRFAGYLTLLLAAAIAVWLGRGLFGRQVAAPRSPSTRSVMEQTGRSDAKVDATSDAGRSTSALLGGSSEGTLDAVARVVPSIVKIVSDGPGRLDSVGTGFVVDPSGLIATSFHVISEHTQARVRFRNGSSYEVAGYAAVRPEADLAVVRIKDPPPDLRAVELRHDDDPEALSPVVAIGHPHGLEFSPYDGAVSRMVRTSELPLASRRFLERLMNATTLDHRWIQHTAQISPGNSGGPLLNASGQVLGVNTWVDEQTSFSYALHARHLSELLQVGQDELIPLEQLARPESRVVAILRRLSADTLRDLAADAERMGWQPSNAADYETLQRVAWAVTIANLPGTLSPGQGLAPDELSELQDVADQIVNRLRKRSWDNPGQITIVNDFAARRVQRPMAGLFFYSTVERVVEGDDGSRAALMRLAGTEQRLLLPLDGQLIRLSAGQQCLILGVNYDGHVVRYGENPLNLTTANVIASRTIIELD